MKIVGTSDEITYIMLQCQKRTSTFCEGCVLNVFCKPEMFMKLSPRKLEALETGKFEPTLIASILISKGDERDVSDVQ